MYFLSDAESKRLSRFQLPRAREQGVADELRGWNWHQPPLEPVYEVRLGVSEVAGGYCPTGRDLFFRRVEKQAARPTPAMLKGKLLHAALAQVIIASKRFIYAKGVQNLRDLPQTVQAEGLSWLEEQSSQYSPALGEQGWTEAMLEAATLIEFEVGRIWGKIQEVMLKHRYIQEDSLVATALPIIVEQKLDGTFLGLSPNLSADAFNFAEPIVVDLKFGPPRDFYRLTTTGYSLVMEALYDIPVNLGCIVYAQYDKGQWRVERDIHIISDELRQRFIEERDDKMRMVYEEIDPGIHGECQSACQYAAGCRG